jgi:hypothetical protein
MSPRREKRDFNARRKRRLNRTCQPGRIKSHIRYSPTYPSEIISQRQQNMGTSGGEEGTGSKICKKMLQNQEWGDGGLVGGGAILMDEAQGHRDKKKKPTRD